MYVDPNKVSGDDYHWDAFMDWASDRGVSMEHKDDWGEWWDCWVQAIHYSKEDAKEQKQ